MRNTLTVLLLAAGMIGTVIGIEFGSFPLMLAGVASFGIGIALAAG